MIILDADDFSAYIMVLPYLHELKKSIPGFKITLFTISRFRPPGKVVNPKEERETHERFAELTHLYDWIEIAQHGLDHSKGEFFLSYSAAMDRIEEMEDWNKKIGLEPVKIFRAPYWQCSDPAYKALRDSGYAVATDRNQPRPDIEGMKQYRWNWSFETERPRVSVTKGHGHVAEPSENNIEACMENLKRLPQDGEFMFVSEYLKEHGSD